MSNPRILIISNNPRSMTSNNGKTLNSFFGDFEYLLQIYFSFEVPIVKGDYIQINEKKIFSQKKWEYHRINEDGSFSSGELKRNKKKAKYIKFKIKKSIYTRLFRECIWKTFHLDKELIQTIKKFNPNIVFFCAGDTLFSYTIVKEIMKIIDAKLITYITDDYLTSYDDDGYLEKIKKQFVRKEIANILKISHQFYTISPMMKDYYLNEFGVCSYNLVNLTEDLLAEGIRVKDQEVVYAGGLHLGRDKVILYLLEKIRFINKKNNTKLKLVVYSKDTMEGKLIDTYIKEEIVHFKGLIGPKELKEKLNEADFLLFMESFDIKMRNLTRYSLSTKVPEYLSLKKPILTIGPNDISSIRYLQECSFCINDLNELDIDEMTAFFLDEDIKDSLAQQARNKYLKYHVKEIKMKEFKDNLDALIRK